MHKYTLEHHWRELLTHGEDLLSDFNEPLPQQVVADEDERCAEEEKGGNLEYIYG